MSINGLLSAAGQSLASNQIAISVTGANIANVNTPGYSRQKAIIGSIGNIAVPGNADFGVSVDSIKKVYDNYLESQIVQQEQGVGYDEARQEILARIEPVFNETGTNGLNDLLAQFWNSWETLSVDPVSSVARAGVVSAGKNLASLVSQKGEALDVARQDVGNSIEDTVRAINSLSEQIAYLNGKIRQLNVDKGEANGFLDSRMEALKELGNNVNIDYYERSDHTVDVFIAGGKMLLGGTNSMELAVTNGNVAFEDYPAETLNSLITGGRLGGMIEMNDVTLTGYINDLNVLADGIVSGVNARHALGFDADGLVGGPFFAALPAGARNMSVSAAIIADSRKVAASSVGTGIDGENARLMAALRDELLMNGATETFGDNYVSLVGRYAWDVKAVDSAVDRNTAAWNQLASQREGALGVSLDEEIMNLVKYQFGYNAAGKLAKTANEMLDVLMSIGQ
jgi:flagellar hook-associated protein 1 FlgK